MMQKIVITKMFIHEIQLSQRTAHQISQINQVPFRFGQFISSWPHKRELLLAIPWADDKYLLSEDNFLQCIKNMDRYIFAHGGFSQLSVNLTIDWLIIGNIVILPFG